MKGRIWRKIDKNIQKIKPTKLGEKCKRKRVSRFLACIAYEQNHFSLKQVKLEKGSFIWEMVGKDHIFEVSLKCIRRKTAQAVRYSVFQIHWYFLTEREECFYFPCEVGDRSGMDQEIKKVGLSEELFL